MTPNLCNDAHDCSLQTADTWLNAWVPKLMAGPDYTSGNLTILITFDEDDSSAGNNVAFVVIDPRLNAKTVTTAANHYSLTRWLEANAGTPLLRNAATAANLKSAFGL
jgi:acid phosphatase